MKINTNTDQVLTNTSAQSSMTVDDSESALFFQIMSSQIYQYKIRAVVRELFCNAVDSHIEAGADKPVTVKWPNKLEPWFSVQDYGTGMSPEFVQQVYRKTLKSTKRSSGEAIGGFGVGKLAPLSYVDQFTLESVYEGVRTTYSIFKNSSGTPDIAVIQQIDTTDHNGVLVKVAAKEKDFKEWSEEITGVLQWFRYDCFECVGTDKSVQSLLTTDKDYYVVSDEDGDLRHSIVVGSHLGGVRYPIPSSVDLTSITNIIGKGYFAPVLILNIDVDDVEVAISRESVSATSATVEAIQSKVDSVAERMKEDYQKKLDSLPSLFEVTKLPDKAVLGRLSSELTYKGLVLQEYVLDTGARKSVLPEGLEYLTRPGWVNVKPKKNPSLVIEPWLAEVRILILDHKHHRQMNRNDFYCTGSGQYNFQCTPEALPATLELFKHCSVHTEKLSERIEAGCKPEPKKRASQVSQKGYPYWVLVDGEAIKKRGNRTEVESEYLQAVQDGKDVYVKVGSLQKGFEGGDIARNPKDLPENSYVLVLNIPVGNWLCKKYTIADYIDMVWVEEEEQKLISKYYQKNLNLSWSAELAASLLRSIGEDCPALLEDCSEECLQVVADRGLNYLSLDLAQFDTFDGDLDDNPFTEVPRELNGLYEEFERKYPLLSIGYLNEREREDSILYINMKNEVIKNAA